VIQSTVACAYFDQLKSDDDIQDDDLPVVPVEFQPFVSFELFSFANDGRLVKFILACTQSRLFGVGSGIGLCIILLPVYVLF